MKIKKIKDKSVKIDDKADFGIDSVVPVRRYGSMIPRTFFLTPELVIKLINAREKTKKSLNQLVRDALNKVYS